MIRRGRLNGVVDSIRLRRRRLAAERVPQNGETVRVLLPDHPHMGQAGQVRAVTRMRRGWELFVDFDGEGGRWHYLRPGEFAYVEEP